MGDGQEVATKAEVQVLIYESLQEYERKVVEPRHQQTQNSLHTLTYLVIAALIGLAANLFTMLAKH